MHRWFRVKFVRIVFFYCLYVFLCLIVVAALMQNLPVGVQILFAFVTPGVWIWWREKRRSQRLMESAASAAPLKESQFPVQKRQNAAPSDTAQFNGFRPITATRAQGEKAATQVVTRSQKPSATDQPVARELAKPWASPPMSSIGVSKPAVSATPKPRGSNRQGWIPNGESVTIAGREIGGMIYVGTPLLLNARGYREKCRAYIDPSLSVAKQGTDKIGNAMPYWPGYSDIPAQCRATYLDWLADGRSNPTYNPGYMFLYFYGLERRFFVDQPSLVEKQDILAEVQRLARLYQGNHSAQRYLGEFIQIAQAATFDANDLEPVFDQAGWELPFTLKLAIGARLERGENLSAEWVLSWLLNHPERNIRTAATRCAAEFKALFGLRFDARFPDGLKVTKPRKALVASYQAASQEFTGSLNPSVDGKPVPDISGLRKPVEIAQEIADEVMDDLDKFSRYLGRNVDGGGSLEAQALLPSELWQIFPSKELEALKSWAATIVAQGGTVPVGDVIVRLEGAQTVKLAKRQLTGAADALARIGYGLAPDPRFALRAPVLGEPVVIFDLGGSVEQLEDVSPTYRGSLVELAFGSFIAHADGTIAEAERQSLLDRIAQTEDLTEQERRRLIANLEWMLAVPPDMTLLRRKLKDTGPESQAALRAALVSAALADGIIQAEEVAGLEKVYKALGLDPALVYSDLHAGGGGRGPVRVKPAQPGAPGEAIPQDRVAAAHPLDAARIAAIRSDTERVSTVLGEIFAGDDEDEPEDAAPASLLHGLDRKHANLVRQIIAQDHWSEDAFDALCKTAGLMSSGALEAINEWAFDRYDEALLDEYDGYDVAPDIAAALKAEFEKEGHDVETETP